MAHGPIAPRTGSTARTLAVLLLAALTLSPLAPAARAQPFPGFEMTPTDVDPSMSSRHLDRYGDLLGLNEDQRATVAMLHEGTMAQLREITEGIVAVIEKAVEERDQDGNPLAIMEVIGEHMGDLQERVEQATGEFFGNVRALLTAEQQERWPAVERLRRRFRLSPQLMFVNGAQVDLTTVLHSLDIERTPELDRGVHAYELDLDRGLAPYEKMARDAQEGVMQAMSEMDFEAVNELFGESYKVGLRVRDINTRHLRLLTAALPAEDASRVTDEYNRRAFPDVYRDPHVVDAIEAARGFADLTKGQRDRIDRVMTEYRREAAGLNAEWVAAIEEQQSEAPESFMELGMRMSGMNPSGPVGDAKADREALDERTLDKLSEILTADQVERLPPQPQTADRIIFDPDGEPVVLPSGGGG